MLRNVIKIRDLDDPRANTISVLMITVFRAAVEGLACSGGASCLGGLAFGGSLGVVCCLSLRFRAILMEWSFGIFCLLFVWLVSCLRLDTFEVKCFFIKIAA